MNYSFEASTKKTSQVFLKEVIGLGTVMMLVL